MKQKNRNIVRIIKGRQEVSHVLTEPHPKATPDIARNITSWVNELRTRRSVEDRLAFRKLFGK
jgi:hypothetical protein